MEDIKIDADKLNTDSLPEFKRTPDGKIDISEITLGKSKRNNDIVPDEIFDKYYRELPDKVENQSGSWRTVSTGGKIKILGGDPEGDRKIQEAGAAALNATKAQQRTFKEVVQEMLVNPAKMEEVERLGLEPGATTLEAIIAGQLQQAWRGNTKAAEFLRDTIGEKPTEKISAEVETITPEDRKQIERILNRTKTQDIVVSGDQE